MASGHPLHGVAFLATATGCGLNKVPLIAESRLPVLRRRVADFLMSICDIVPTVNGFVRAAVFSHALTVVCVFSNLSAQPSICCAFRTWCFAF